MYTHHPLSIIHHQPNQPSQTMPTEQLMDHCENRFDATSNVPGSRPSAYLGSPSLSSSCQIHICSTSIHPVGIAIAVDCCCLDRSSAYGTQSGSACLRPRFYRSICQPMFYSQILPARPRKCSVRCNHTPSCNITTHQPKIMPERLNLSSYTHTLLAHLVTLLPSFKQSTSPFPPLSVLHCMKSSLYDLHLAPIKKEAERRGADEAPTSVTAGMESGRGVVSIKVDWLKLQCVSFTSLMASSPFRLSVGYLRSHMNIPWLSS